MMTKYYWEVFMNFPFPKSDHYLQAHFDGGMFPASGWWDIDDEWDCVEEL